MAERAGLRKGWSPALINTGREVLALAAAAGFYYLALRSGEVEGVSLDLLPPVVVLLGIYFLATRGLFYFALLVREKLAPEERLFVLRWEIQTFLVSVLAAGTVVWALHTLSPTGWLAMLLALGVVGLLARTLIEEAIAAEDLNKVHLMQAAVTANVSLQTAFEQIEQFAHRLLDWDDFRIYRVDGTVLSVAYEGQIRRPGVAMASAAVEPLRQRVLREGRAVVVGDAIHELGLPAAAEVAPSRLLQPLKFADQTVGTVEVSYRKRQYYRARDVAALAAVANQLSTAIHIAELRQPLLLTVDQIDTQLRGLARAADSLRASAGALAMAGDALRHRAAAQEEFARQGLATTASLGELSAATAESGARAASVSRAAASAAARNQVAVSDAIGRLVKVQGFVTESTGQVSALGEAAGRLSQFFASIRDIAELTDLIALNATIEASRAGPEGRGFGVVAEEVRRLATQTDRTAREAGELAAEIGTEVAAILAQMQLGRAMVADVEHVSEDAVRALAAIVDAAGEAGREAGAIAAAAASQQQASERLAGQIRQIADTVGKTRSDVDRLAAEAAAASGGQAELEQAIGQLENVVAELQRIARHVVIGR
jgi:methyl-accepting chemotaxis protein